MVLLDNREVKKGWQALKDSVCAMFTKHGAQIRSARRWDERRLAYAINHQLRGTYLLLYFDSDTQQLSHIRRDLDYAEPVMRYLTMTCDVVPEAAFQPEEAFDESQVRVETSADRRAEVASEVPTGRPRRGAAAEPVEETSDEEAGEDQGESVGADASGDDGNDEDEE